MADTQFSLEWDSHNKNICNGLSSLQQNGEFVDMTVAADGHHVKVHQMVLALASPYIKDLITSANCPHPVIFLNKVSYKTLCSVLEYIYTGQTQVAMEDISALIMAAKELHIKGLEDVKASPGTTELNADIEEQPSVMPEIQIKLQRPDTSSPLISKLSTLKRKLETSNSSVKPLLSMPPRKRTTLFNKPEPQRDMPVLQKDMPVLQKDMPVLQTDDGKDDARDFGFDDPLDDDHRADDDDNDDANEPNDTTTAVTKSSADPANPQMSVQYTVSNQGSLQLILNRFIYFLYYQYRDKSRQWRCVDNRNNKCMASVYTKDNVVVRRVGAHNHPFHDRTILKKVRAGAVYSAIHEAEAKTTRTPRGHP